MSFELLDHALELSRLLLGSDGFYDRASGCDAQFREKVAHQMDVGIIDSVESNGVDFVEYYYSFVHIF